MTEQYGTDFICMSKNREIFLPNMNEHCLRLFRQTELEAKSNLLSLDAGWVGDLILRKRSLNPFRSMCFQPHELLSSNVSLVSFHIKYRKQSPSLISAVQHVT